MLQQQVSLMQKQNKKYGLREITKTDTYFPAVLKCTDIGRQCDSAKASKPLKDKMLKQEKTSVSCVHPHHK